MNLKESFRVQNKLNELLQSTRYYLQNQNNITKVTQEHMRTKANKEAVDETIEKPNLSLLPYEVNKIIDFALYLVREKEKLNDAIDVAKTKCGTNIDNSITNNKNKKELCDLLNSMATIKSSERLTRAQDYKFNVAGDQVAYNYEVKEVTTIDFDRNKVRNIYKQLSKEIDDVSNKIDEIKINSEVDYIFEFDVNDKFEDILEQFCSK